MSRNYIPFKKLYHCRLPYKKQGYVYFLCLNYNILDEATQNKIKDLCFRVGGIAYQNVLFEMMTHEQSVRYIANKYYTSERNLYRLRLRFFELWWGN